MSTPKQMVSVSPQNPDNKIKRFNSTFSSLLREPLYGNRLNYIINAFSFMMSLHFSRAPTVHNVPFVLRICTDSHFGNVAGQSIHVITGQ